jgi:hypothetical protein
MNETRGIANTMTGYSIRVIKGEGIYEKQITHRHANMHDFSY